MPSSGLPGAGVMWNDLITEVRKLLAQRKNYVVFGGLALSMILFILNLHSRGMSGFQQTMMREAGTTLDHMLDGLYYARLVLVPMNLMVLPIFICTVAGDLVAGELQEGCLKLYAARPRSRFRILFTRILAMFVFACGVCAAVGGAALGVGVLIYGMPGTQLVFLDQSMVGSEFIILTPHQAMERIGADAVYRVFSLMALGSMTLFFSCIFKRMTTATVTGITVYVCCYLIGLMPDAQPIRPYLISTVMNSDMYLWLGEVPWQRLILSFSNLCAYILIFCGLSLTAFTYRDLA